MVVKGILLRSRREKGGWIGVVSVGGPLAASGELNLFRDKLTGVLAGKNESKPAEFAELGGQAACSPGYAVGRARSVKLSCSATGVPQSGHIPCCSSWYIEPPANTASNATVPFGHRKKEYARSDWSPFISLNGVPLGHDGKGAGGPCRAEMSGAEIRPEKRDDHHYGDHRCTNQLCAHSTPFRPLVSKRISRTRSLLDARLSVRLDDKLREPFGKTSP